MATCSVVDCQKPSRCRGMCRAHYSKWWRSNIGADKKYIRKYNKINSLSSDRTYMVFSLIKRSCYETTYSGYPQVGARGIKVCDRWRGNNGYKNFLEDMGTRPNSTVLRRYDNTKDFTPDNCYWVNQREARLNGKLYVSNRSGVPGVYLDKNSKNWHTTLTVNGKKYSLGSYKEIEDAKEARKRAVAEYLETGKVTR